MDSKERCEIKVADSPLPRLMAWTGRGRGLFVDMGKSRLMRVVGLCVVVELPRLWL